MATEKDHTVPPLLQRFKGVLLEPGATFRALDPAWGILGPYLLVAGSGLLYAFVSLAQVDSAGLAARKKAYAFSVLPDQVRRLLDKEGIDASTDAGKGAALVERILAFLGPTVLSLVAIVAVGVILFAASSFLGGKRDLLRAVVVAAHAKLVCVLGYAVTFVGLVLGNPYPATSPRNLADEVRSPLAFVALSILDPFALWQTGLLALGLAVALGVRRGRAVAVAVALLLIPWLLGLAAAGFSQSMMGGK